MEKLRPGQARGLAGEHMVTAVSVRHRPEHLILICRFMAHACTYTHSHAQAKFSKQENGRDVFASKGRLLILSSLCLLTCIRRGARILLCPI